LEDGSTSSIKPSFENVISVLPFASRCASPSELLWASLADLYVVTWVAVSPSVAASSAYS